ncbi:Xaa-Pro dipeptidyl-peptidase [Clostridiaceae bacterium 35-E11]
MLESREYTNIKTLQKLKLIDEDASFLDKEFLVKPIENVLFKKVISRLTQNTDFDAMNLENNHLITEKEFYCIAIALLDYEIDVECGKDQIIDFAKRIGLSPTGHKDYTNADFFNSVVDLLKAKTKDGIDYFENLCLNGVFKDYNKGKKIPEILVFNGKTQPIFDYKESIFEKVFIETPLDTDQDNQRDLIVAYIRRPLESNYGMKVPVIYVANPYMMGTNDHIYKPHHVDVDLEIFPETDVQYEDIKYQKKEIKLPEPRKILGKADSAILDEEVAFECITPWYNYFLVRGYAIVFAGGIGTRGSEGIRTCGSVEETISTISVIDWLNKKVKGFTNKTDHLEVVAHWCSGNVGMTGKSYLGTLAIAAATTGVEGLKTIVPEAAISNWYEYYRCNGLNLPAIGWQGDDADLLAEHCFSRMFDTDDYEGVKSCFDHALNQLKKDQDRITGNYNKFWDERNYLNDADKIQASVFIVHGLRDWNVKPKQFDMLWRALEKYNIPRKMILHQGGHIYINNLEGIDYSDIMNKWFGHWLYDIPNNIMEEIPSVMIQNNAYIHQWDHSNHWPFEGVEKVKFFVDHNHKLTKTKNDDPTDVIITDDLSLTGYDRQKPDESIWLDAIVREPEIQKPYRAAYTSDILSKDTRISGTVNVEIRAKLDSGTGIISAMLVDYGTEKRPALECKSIKKDAMKYGINAGTADLVDFMIDETSTDFDVITRGWMSAQNRRNNYNKDEVIVDKEYTFKFDMQPIDYTLLKGHRLGFIIYSTDVQATQRQHRITNLTISSKSIVVRIPLK